MARICSKCKYERPNNYRGVDTVCPVCNTPYEESSVSTFSQEPNPQSNKALNTIPAIANVVVKGETPEQEKRELKKLIFLGLIILVPFLWLAKCSSDMNKRQSAFEKSMAEECSRDSGPDSYCAAYKNAGTGISHCFTTGESMATTYLANLRGAADVGLMASDFMQNGCAQHGNAECASECQRGFKFGIKQVLK